MIGCDVTIDLSALRALQLQRIVNEEEQKMRKPTGIDDVTDAITRLQKSIASLALVVKHIDFDVITFLVELIVESGSRLQRDDNSDVIMLPAVLQNQRAVIDFIELIGFDLQLVEEQPHSSFSSFMIIFPHCDHDVILLRAHQALIGLNELLINDKCLVTSSNILPLQQHHLCRLVDLLLLFKHSPATSVMINHATIYYLWNNREIQEYLAAIGVREVRKILVFLPSLHNRQLLLGSLQMMISFCLHRSYKLLEKFDLEVFGTIPRAEETKRHKKLKSLDVVELPDNKISVHCSHTLESDDKLETTRRKKLAEQLDHLTCSYQQTLRHLKDWHKKIRFPCLKKLNLDKNYSVDNSNEGDKKQRKDSMMKIRQEAEKIYYKRQEEVKRRYENGIKSSYLTYS